MLCFSKCGICLLLAGCGHCGMPERCIRDPADRPGGGLGVLAVLGLELLLVLEPAAARFSSTRCNVLTVVALLFDLVNVLRGPETDGLAVDGLAVDGLAVDGLAVDGLAVDGLAVDGLAVDGLAVDGLAEDDLPVIGLRGEFFRVLCCTFGVSRRPGAIVQFVVQGDVIGSSVSSWAVLLRSASSATYIL